MSKKIIKKLIVFSLLGGALFLANLVLAQNFGTNELSNGLNNSLQGGDPRTIIGRIINLALGFLGVVAVGIILWAGFIWMTAGGDEEKIENAKKYLKNGLIGLAIILSSWAIATFVLTQLSNAVGGTGGGCTDGQIQSCYCGGSMECSGGTWGACIFDPANCSGTSGQNCSSDPDVCEPSQQKCNPQADYCDTDCLCKPKGNLGDPCDADSDPSNACVPDNNKCAEYLSCNADTCLCFGPPVITELSPLGGFCLEDLDKACVKDSDCVTTCDQKTPNGTNDNIITIFGKNFGTYSATSSKVIFLGSGNPQEGKQPTELNPACIDSWRDDQIIIAVPSGVTTGPIKVITNSDLTDLTNDTYGPIIPDFEANSIARPGLCKLNPNRGILSSEVTYEGVKLYSGDAYFGNYESNVRGLVSDFSDSDGLSGTSTTPNIRSGDSGSFVISNVNGNNQKSNYLRFIKDPEAGEGPYIISFAPLAGKAGQYVTINGSGFGGARGISRVYFGNTEASYDFPEVCLNSVWKDKQVIVKVPDGLSNDDYLIRINLGTTTIDTQKINPSTFEVDDNLPLKTSLCKIDPTIGPVATPVSLWGEYFGTTNNEGLVKFNIDKSATGTIQKDGRADRIDTLVPNGAITGPVRVIKNSAYGNELNFEIGKCLVNSDCENTKICCPTNTYKEGRCADSLADCYINIPTSVFEWSFNTSFGSATSTPYDSCLGASQYLGACLQGSTCPNSPGACSSVTTSYQKTVGSCDITCQGIPGCSIGTCVYNQTIDRCVKNSCNLPQTVTFSNGYTTQKFCNSEGKWEITSPGSCPDGWTRLTNNRCVDNTTSCNLCSNGFSCQVVNSNEICVSEKICADSDAKCFDNPSGTDWCKVEIKPSCECCCRIGKDQEDCCAGLKCAGSCGADLVGSGALGTCCDVSGNCVNPNCPGLGGTVAEIGGYCLHTFTNSGTFKTDLNLNATVLAVGGGGGGGGGLKNAIYDAGGGGGQVIENSISIPPSSTAYPVIVGSAGLSGTINSPTIYNNNNTDGGNSSFLTITALGGKKATSPGTGGISGSGKVGGLNNDIASGGGGGDSQAGFNAPNSSQGGNGGDGTYSDISGTNIAYGGGGPGSSAFFQGIGGDGWRNSGGGAGHTGIAGNEAKPGVVIIKYQSVPASACPPGYSSSSNTYGNCSGCGLIGSSTQAHDDACNCSGHASKFCDISAAHPEGICVDCASITSQENCGDHSSACCFDAKGTATTTDDICRGVNGGQVVSTDPGSDYGYCAYYDCQNASSTPPGNPALCASSTPDKLGSYKTIDQCTTGCLANPGTNICSSYNGDQANCIAASSCCFDEATQNCLGGPRITSGQKAGFCAYYNCQTASSTPPGDPKLCDLNATTTGQFISTSTCIFECANNYSGAGLSCASQTATSSCEIQVCNLPGFACLTAAGGTAAFPDCGACCCQPGLNPDTCWSPATPNLHCQANQGNCSGASRGLCCGCSSDNDCGHPETIGCGLDTCCEARPSITSTLPEHLDNNVCRNAVVKVDFDQLMDITSFNSNVLLLEERVYGNGVCPAGTFIAQETVTNLIARQNSHWLASLYNQVKTIILALKNRFSNQAIADTPDPSKLYCAIPGAVSAETTGSVTSLIFVPQKLLSPMTNYYLVVKGDESLNSQTGVLSLKEIGFNGPGYSNAGTYVEGSLITFNGRAYPNSQIIKFTTLSDQGSKAGVCVINQVKLNPDSYLFKTTTNDLNENDTDPSNRTFDTKIDKDKVFSAWAYSVDNQLLQPVTGYFWDWTFTINNPNVAEINLVNGLDLNRAFVSARSGITDSETKITAEINMDRFMTGTGCDSSSNCVCLGDNCLNNCCNAYFTGDSYNKVGNLYVFICNNPWPPVGANGSWSPWEDNCSGAIGGACADYNYKFYYCRDNGDATTLDDLPAIINQAVIRGQSNSLLCSYDRTPCPIGANPTTKCGVDQNGDGELDGLCIWNVLKESYFFRETIPASGQITAATDQLIGRTIKVEWQSPATQVASYKIYYLQAGKSNMQVKEVPLAGNCALNNNTYTCNTLIENLINDKDYIFKVSVISVNKTESQLSNEKTAKPTDKTAPPIPSGLSAQITNSSLTFSWGALQIDPSLGDSIFFRLYHGINPGQYGESFDSEIGATSLTFNLSQFPAGNNYFAVSSLDNYGNESNRSSEITVLIP